VVFGTVFLVFAAQKIWLQTHAKVIPVCVS